MRKMDDLHLVDFVELQLKSKEDFNTAYNMALSTGLADYAKQFIIFQPGDWPCQFFCHQIIYQCVKKFISYQQPHQVNCENPQAASDHSAYSYPSFTGSDNEQSLPSNLSSQPSILSVIPMIGPLHISWMYDVCPKWWLESFNRLLSFLPQYLLEWLKFMSLM